MKKKGWTWAICGVDRAKPTYYARPDERLGYFAVAGVGAGERAGCHPSDRVDSRPVGPSRYSLSGWHCATCNTRAKQFRACIVVDQRPGQSFDFPGNPAICRGFRITFRSIAFSLRIDFSSWRTLCRALPHACSKFNWGKKGQCGDKPGGLRGTPSVLPRCPFFKSIL